MAGTEMIRYIANLTAICRVKLTGMIFVKKKFPPSRVTEVAEKDVPMLRNMISTKTTIPGRTPLPKTGAPTLDAISLEK